MSYISGLVQAIHTQRQTFVQSNMRTTWLQVGRSEHMHKAIDIADVMLS